MKIELLMRSLDQEFPDRSSTSASPEVNWDNGWPYDSRPPHCDRWSYHQNFPFSESPKQQFLHNVRIRSESFGGLLYDMRTKAVFSLDEEAFRTIQLMLEGVPFVALTERAGLSEEDVTYLKDSLERYCLCTS